MTLQNIDNVYFEQMINNIYPKGLKLDKVNPFDKKLLFWI